MRALQRLTSLGSPKRTGKLLGVIALLSTGLSLAGARDKGSGFDGEIMDKQCAQMHSHDNMMKAEGATNAKECALKCTKNGDKFALLDAANNKVYVIDDDKKVEPFAGQKVHIVGSYDDDSETLKIKSIAAK
jgi:hypothetical protein